MAGETDAKTQQVLAFCRRVMHDICAQQPRFTALEATEALDSLRLAIVALAVAKSGNSARWMEVELVKVEDVMLSVKVH